MMGSGIHDTKMRENKKTKEDMRCSKRCDNWLFLCRKIVAEGFIAK